MQQSMYLHKLAKKELYALFKMYNALSKAFHRINKDKDNKWMHGNQIKG